VPFSCQSRHNSKKERHIQREIFVFYKENRKIYDEGTTGTAIEKEVQKDASG